MDPAPPKPAARVRRGLGRLALAVLVPLASIELFLRVGGPHVPAVAPLLYHPKVVHEYDRVQTLEELLDLSVLGFRPRTRRGDFVLNSRSFLTEEYAEAKPPGSLRILAIGDSFTFSCGGVPHRAMWHARLEDELRRRTAAGVEVLNLGIPAVGPEFELRLWQLEGSKLDADLVVVAFVVGTNFLASSAAKRERTWVDHLAIGSCTFRFARNGLRLWASRSDEREPRSTERELEQFPVGGVPAEEVMPGYRSRYDPERPFLSEERFTGMQKVYWKSCARIEGRRIHDSVAETLVRFRDEVVAAGAEFVVMIVPCEVQLSPELRARVRSERGPRGLPDPSLSLDAPQRFLREVFEREGIDYLDLLPAFTEAARDRALYGANDTHWNSAGNALAGELLLEYLTESRAGGEPWPWQRSLTEPEPADGGGTR